MNTLEVNVYDRLEIMGKKIDYLNNGLENTLKKEVYHMQQQMSEDSTKFIALTEDQDKQITKINAKLTQLSTSTKFE